MKKIVIASMLALALVLSLVGVASAITNGQPDGDNHPYVGLLIFGWDTPGGFVPGWRCSGALITPDLVLTAGHCTDGADKAVVWFDEGPIDWGTWDPDANPTCIGEKGYPCTGDVDGTPYTNPKYRSDENPYGGGNGLPAFSYRDVGVVVLDDPIYLDEMAELPDPGLVDTLKNKTGVDFVGYGVQYQAQIPGKYLPPPPPYNRWTGLRQRMYAPSETVSGNFVHSPEYMRLALNPGGGTGGTCFGDSGGPDLLGGTNTVLAVNSYVTNINCKGVGYSARVDIPEVLEWINSFITDVTGTWRGQSGVAGIMGYEFDMYLTQDAAGNVTGTVEYDIGTVRTVTGSVYGHEFTFVTSDNSYWADCTSCSVSIDGTHFHGFGTDINNKNIEWEANKQ